MAGKIYKYFPKDALNLVFRRDTLCGVKCSFPKNYNDPYELFLGIDSRVPINLLAIFKEVVKELPQNPTTCFSKSPIVAPMWAHYAKNFSGFVLEFDAECLKRSFKEAALYDVTYKDEPDPKIGTSLARIAETKKPRHAIWLQRIALSEAYFSKYTDWSYEQECRLVVSEKDIEVINDCMILFAPIRCITSIIVGNKMPEAEREASRAIADDNGLKWYEAKIGKSFPVPYLLGDDDAFVFGDTGIAPAANVCGACSEPVTELDELCAWCRITGSHEVEAAMGNPLRVLDHLDMLDGYLEEVGKIEEQRE